MHLNHLLSMAQHLIASRMISWLNTWPRALLSLLTLFFLTISMFCRFLFLFALSLSPFLKRRFYLNQTKIFNFGQILRNAQRKMHRISTTDKSEYENRCFNLFLFIWKRDRFFAKIMYSISLYHHRKHLSFLDVFSFKVKLDNIWKYCSKTFKEKLFCLPIKARALNIRKSRYSYKRILICQSYNNLYNKLPKLDGISEIFDGKIANVSIDHMTASGCDYGFDYYPIEQWG